MDDITITFAIVAAVVVLFVWGRVPVEVVAVGAALALWATGVLDLRYAGWDEPAPSSRAFSAANSSSVSFPRS